MTTTKLEPELPEPPPYDYYVTLANGDDYGCWSRATIRAYALSAIEADRNKRAVEAADTDLQHRAQQLKRYVQSSADAVGDKVHGHIETIDLLLALASPAPDTPEGKEAVALSDEEVLSVLADIFSNTERPDKITVSIDEVTRDIVVKYEHLDSEWFRELREALAAAQGGRKT